MKGTVTKETEKYTYTTEVIDYVEKQYFLTSCTGTYCTVYASKEAAEAAIPEMRKLFRDTTTMKVVEKEYHGVKIVHHRYKK